MKKLITLTIALVLGFTLSSFAGNGTSIHTLITRTIKVPEQLKNQKLDEKVDVQFTIGQNGTASIVDVKTENPELKKYIIQQFSTINFNEATDKQQVTYFIAINFKVL
ncbi:MAG: hypothetical protein JWP12_3399 [Bacteroidetes bacterium]|nr:hypothetical protein [Bacteroidota bacterium]